MQSISLNKYVKRFLITLVWIIVFLIFLEMFIPSAGASSSNNSKDNHALVTIPTFKTTTTTTTTTTPPTTTTTTAPEPVITAPKATAPPAPAYVPTGDWVAQCHAWAAQAGVTLPPSAITLIGRESSCNPSVMNHGGSGAGGIPQALPYTKMGCSMDVAGAPCQIQWMLNYVNARYGGWDGALAHSNSHNWY